MTAEATCLLRVENVCLNFSGVKVLDNVGLEVCEKQIMSVIGPNGAGKTSLLNCISGFYKPKSGGIYFRNKKISGMSPHDVTRNGIARAFQNNELFYGLTVLGNLMLPRHKNLNYSLLETFFYTPRVKRIEAENRVYAEKIIDFMELETYRHTIVGNLSYGLRKRVEVARALCLNPSLILLDEPMAGMNTGEKENMVRFVLEMRNILGITVVLIEHDLGVVMDISDHIAVLDFGVPIAHGTADEVSTNPEVIRAYIGE